MFWSFSFSISPSRDYSGLASFRTDWFGLLGVQGTLNQSVGRAVERVWWPQAQAPLGWVGKSAVGPRGTVSRKPSQTIFWEDENASEGQCWPGGPGTLQATAPAAAPGAWLGSLGKAGLTAFNFLS